ncbi:nucleotidyltransferase domain-containing protein [bacterium]|nr:nucleotidyltransferase domain-containing protein [bacterium]
MLIFNNELMMAPKKAEEQIKEIIFRFLDAKEYRVFIFGSRATGEAKKYSDYDIGIFGKKPISFEILGLIDEAFENSDLPYKVDVVDFSMVSKNFKKIALSKIKILNP